MAINKSRFHVKAVDYLGYVITDKGISLSPEKVRTVKSWNPPVPDATSAVKWAQEFLGFANFYRRFIGQFSKIAKPLSHLTKKDQRYAWTPACRQEFDALKSWICEAAVFV